MIEALVAAVSGIAGLFIFQFFQKKQADKEQKALEVKTAVIENEVKHIQQEITEKDKQTQEKIDAITEEQTKPVTVDNLLEFFNNRKK